MPRPVKKRPTGRFRGRIAAIKKAAKKVSKGPAPLPSPRPIKGKGGKVRKPTLMPVGSKPMKPVKGRGKSAAKFYDMKGNLISDGRKPVLFKKRK
jgi:hypothetical protein